jgi:hypothetical protein
MRTTLDLDTPVLERLKKLAERRGVSLGRLTSDLLTRALKDQGPGDEPATGRFRWKPVAMGAPRVSLEDADRLWELLDETPARPAGTAARPPKRRRA